ncbi:MAG: TonB-dependent receptor [bacterium]
MRTKIKFRINWIVFAFLLQSFLGSTYALETAIEDPPSGAIRGKVVDASTGEPLMGANVFLEHTSIGCAANVSGEYHILKAPIGTFHLVASMIGYIMEHKVVTVTPNSVISVDFKLQSTILEMGAIVVTGTATPHIYEDSPVRTTVIPRKLIEKKQSVNLAEALSFATGVRVENSCQNCNFSQVRILGLDGKYSQILIDGDPVVSSLAGVYGLEQIPEEMIDQIEIVKGGGSSLYGGGAVAGVINMITRRPMTNQVRLRYLRNSVEGDMDQRLGATAEFINTSATSGGYIFGSARQRNPHDHNGDGYSELGELNNESLGFNWYLKPSETGEFYVHLHRIHEQRRGGNKLDLPPHEAEIAEALEHWRWGGTFRWSQRPSPLFDYRFYYSFALQKRKSYYGGLGGYTLADTLEALSFYGKTDNPLHVGGAQMNYNLGSQLLTAGIQYSRDGLEDRATANPLYYIDEVYTNFGVFLQDNLHFGKEEEVEFVVGARIDKHSEIDDWILSPRINAKFQLGGGLTLRGAFTTGFKPPQTYDEDLHLCGIGGDQRVTRNADDLKSEKSYSFSGGFEFQNIVGKVPMMAGLTGFMTTLKDAFTEEFVSKTGNIERWERVNGSGARVRGVEFDLGIRPARRVELRGGLTYKKSEYEEVLEDWNTRNFLRTPDLYGNIWMLLELSSNITLFTFANYSGRADVPHEIVVEGQDDPLFVLEKSDPYLEIDLGLSFGIPLITGVNSKLSVGLKNITNTYQKDLDKGPNRDPAYVYGPIRPRTFYVSLETVF